MKRILIAIVSDRFPYPEFVRGLFRNIIMDIFELARKGYRLDYVDIINKPRDAAREYSVETFKAQCSDPDDRILFLDTDMIHPDHTILRLLDRDKLVVGGFYVKRDEPDFPLVGKFSHHGKTGAAWFAPMMDIELNQLYKCDVTGAGCLMIKRSVFDLLEPPFFHHNPPYDRASEEMAFFEACRTKKVDVYVDTSVDCPHAHTSFVDFVNFDMLRKSKGKTFWIEKDRENGDDLPVDGLKKVKMEIVKDASHS